MKSVEKARELFNAKIQFVSLVDAAANKRRFLIAKAKKETEKPAHYGRIIKSDDQQHYVTGIVYEPMSEDTDGEFMTAAEIQKAAFYYAKNFELVDVQHSQEPEEDCHVVESWTAKADFSIGNEEIKKGTWLITVEIDDEDLWGKIEKGEITGFSMGGTAMSQDQEVDLSAIEKGNNPDKGKQNKEPSSNKGILTKFAEFLGLKVIEKGDMAEIYEGKNRDSSFWNAFDALERSLRWYDERTNGFVYEQDEMKITEALRDFDEIITRMLTGAQPLAKAIEGPQTAADSSKERMEIKKESKEVAEVTREQAEEIVAKAVEEYTVNKGCADAKAEPEEREAAEQQTVEKTATVQDEPQITKELLSEMVKEAMEVAKAQNEAQPQISMEDVKEIIASEVQKAIEPIKKANHLPSNLNHEAAGSGSTEVHYLHGII